MSFVSSEFLVLLAIVVPPYFLLPRWVQNYLLLVASYVFYGWWDPRFLTLIAAISTLDYGCALAIARGSAPVPRPALRRLALATSLAGNLLTLGFFKYFGFFVGSLHRLGEAIHLNLPLPVLHVVLPVGVSFFVFQSMSYTIDVYRGRLPATRRYLDYLLFVSFFPQLVAGPIERATHLLPQVLSPRQPTLAGCYSGVQLMAVGCFKKLVLADNLALVADRVFDSAAPQGWSVLLGTYAFALQIYCDFSAYTDIARGVARVLGFEIVENFRFPFLATDPSDFWQRWHISLSSWLRDYLYVPLGGSHGGRWLTLRNLMLTMLLGGLWHGAAWHFVVWGAYHGALLVIYRVLPLAPLPAGGPLGWRFWLRCGIFFQLSGVGWLVFRATSLTQVWQLLRGLGTGWSLAVSPEPALLVVPGLGLSLVAFQAWHYRRADPEPWTRWPAWLRCLFYVGLFYGLVFLTAAHRNAFIYFQF